MKRIILLLVTLLSFSAKADMELLWEQEINGGTRTDVFAYCVFVNESTDRGSVYLYTYSYFGREYGLVSVEQFIDPYSVNSTTCDRKTKVED